MAHQAPEEHTMKFRETAFFHELVAVVVGTVLAVASFAFIAIPLSIAPTTVVLHLT